MLQQPLLYSSEQSDRGKCCSSSSCDECRNACAELLRDAAAKLGSAQSLAAKWMKLWWQTTTNKGFLESRVSRRRSWKVLYPLLGLMITVIDIAGGMNGTGDLSWLALDGVFLLAALVYAKYATETGSLFYDAVFGFLGGSTVFIEMSFGDIETVSCSPLGAIAWANCMMFSCFLGQHSLTVMWYWLLCVVSCVTREVQTGVGWQILVMTTFVAIGCICLEFALAWIFSELQDELVGNQRLLDCATDGFGVVNCSDGVLTQASPKMLQTLRRNHLVGTPLASLVDQKDHIALKTFFGDASCRQQPEAVLVTCTSESLQFEVRLVPYKMQETLMQIGFSVQMVGEARSVLPPQLHQGGSSASRPPRGKASENVGMCSVLSEEQGHASEKGEVDPDALASGEGLEDLDDIDSASQVGPLPSESGRIVADLNYLAPPSQHSADSSSHQSFSKATWRTLGSLSLSSWSGSAPPMATKAKVVMHTMGTQTDMPFDGKKSKPPAPMSASSLPKALQTRALRRSQLAKSIAATVEEGKPALPCFKATPRSTRWNSLYSVLRSCNVGGSGCCSKHVSWMSIQVLVTAELAGKCEKLPFCRGWQCPQCFGLNDWEDGVPEEDVEQICTLCKDIVQPVLPTEALGLGASSSSEA